MASLNSSIYYAVQNLILPKILFCQANFQAITSRQLNIVLELSILIEKKQTSKSWFFYSGGVFIQLK
jgi:hypothetical protein